MRGLTSVGCLTVESYLAAHSAAMSSALCVSPGNFLLISSGADDGFSLHPFTWSACGSMFIPRSPVETGVSLVMVTFKASVCFAV